MPIWHQIGFWRWSLSLTGQIWGKKMHKTEFWRELLQLSRRHHNFHSSWQPLLNNTVTLVCWWQAEVAVFLLLKLLKAATRLNQSAILSYTFFIWKNRIGKISTCRCSDLVTDRALSRWRFECPGLDRRSVFLRLCGRLQPPPTASPDPDLDDNGGRGGSTETSIMSHPEQK